VEVGDGAWVAPDTEADGSSAPAPSAVGPGGTGTDRRPGSLPPPPLPFGPMTTGAILDGAFTVLKRRPRTVLAITAVIEVPVQVVAVFLQRNATVSLTSSSTTTTTSGSDVGAFYAGIGAGVLLSTLALFFLGAALAHLVAGWYRGVDVRAGEALKVAGSHWWALVLAWLVLLPVKAAGLLTCGIGLVFIVPLFVVTAPAIALEGLGPLAGAKRSMSLVGRRYFPVMGVVLLATLVEYVLRQVLVIIPTLIGSALPEPFTWIVVAAGTAGVSLITVAPLSTACVLVYLDLRVRTEGLDLDLAARTAFPEPTVPEVAPAHAASPHAASPDVD